MQTFQVKLSQLVANEDNPRIITDGNLQKLITSILVFPKMLALRPIVVDNTMTALGGNMRLRALTAIATFSPEQIANRLQGSTDYEVKTPAEREALINHWRAWLEDPTAEVASDETLTEDERRAFIIKDNVGYGEWDTEALQNEWDEKRLSAWGLETWQDKEEEQTWGDLNPNELGNDFTLPSGDKEDLINTTFQLTRQQAEFVKAQLIRAKNSEEEKDETTLLNIIQQWDAAKKSSSK